MGARGLSFDLTDFTGGLNTFDPEFSTPLAQSPDLDNIVILDRGFKKRQGDAVWNSSAMVSSSTAVVGLGYMKVDGGTEYLNAVAGTKFFVDSGLSGTLLDKTGSVSITSGSSNMWTAIPFNNLQCWFGGNPDTPFKYSGSGNAAVLGGTPPSAYTGFAANNRLFGISTVANPSRVYWSVLTNQDSWTGAGSGNADVSISDGEALQCGIQVGTDSVILFKNSSTHLMVITSAPFPIYQLQRGVGISGRNAWAYADGVIYFVTPGRRMLSTSDGVNFDIYPNDINDLWDSINVNRIANIQGIFYRPLEWVIFCVSTGSSTTNNYAIIWDRRHKCFLRCTTGFASNVFALVQNRRLFAGQYDGKIYEKDKATVFTDASVASPGAINGYWRTPFHGMSTFDPKTLKFAAPFSSIIHPLWIDFSFLNETATTMELSYGFDYSFPQKIVSSSLVTGAAQWDVAQWDVDNWGGSTSVGPRVFVSGRGNVFSLKIRNATASQGFTCQGFSTMLRTDRARKLLTVA